MRNLNQGLGALQQQYVAGRLLAQTSQLRRDVSNGVRAVTLDQFVSSFDW